MIAAPRGSAARLELVEVRPAVDVVESEYQRLLGYPRDYQPGERALELAAEARRWYAEHGYPWIYLREAELRRGDGPLLLDGVAFHSRQLHEHLRAAGARRALLVVVSAGRACEEHARELWRESKPDEYFFLEMFGSAVVERLCAMVSGRICELADRDGLVAIPHYSPGYTGWEIAEQNKLFEVITRRATQPFPEPLEVLSSGMLRPKKSLLAVVGLAPRTAGGFAAARRVPCESCGLSPCRYRRAPYRHALAEAAPPAPATPMLTPAANYTVGHRALAKWAAERVAVTPRADGSIEARFRFDGTTCSNMGRPLAFEYTFELGSSAENYRIRRAGCRPVEGEDGYRQMCAYLSDADGLMAAIAAPPPLLGRPLDDVLAWKREAAPSGCYCTAASRAHKWGLALEAIHYALAQNPPPSPPPAVS